MVSRNSTHQEVLEPEVQSRSQPNHWVRDRREEERRKEPGIFIDGREKGILGKDQGKRV